MSEIDEQVIRNDFQSLILIFQNYWAQKGCVILQPYDMEVGAGTFHPATTLRSLGPDAVSYTHLTLPTILLV